jgi:integrase
MVSKRKEKERKRIGLNEVRSLAPGAMIWDSGVTGFCARRQRSEAVTYYLFCRINGQQRWIKIGRHGDPWTPETARKEARSILGRVADGDPAAEKQAARKAFTVAELAAKFLTEHAEAKRKASTAREYRRLVERVILPALGKKRLVEVTRQDVAKLHHARRATPTEANRALACLSTMFNYAEKIGERPDGSNPCRHIEKYPQQQRKRYLSAEELARLSEALTSSDDSNPYATAAIRLLLYTGARRGEIQSLCWDWIDLEKGEATLPDSKTGPKTLHLPSPALAILAELPRIEGNPHVICGAKPGSALVNLAKPWRAVCNAARLRSVRLHDLRHSFASIAVSNGLSLPILGKVLGHSQPQTTARYAHLQTDPVKAAAATVAGKIAAAMEGGSSKADYSEMIPLDDAG